MKYQICTKLQRAQRQPDENTAPPGGGGLQCPSGLRLPLAALSRPAAEGYTRSRSRTMSFSCPSVSVSAYHGGYSERCGGPCPVDRAGRNTDSGSAFRLV